jgi:hypothetical protein
MNADEEINLNILSPRMKMCNDFLVLSTYFTELIARVGVELKLLRILDLGTKKWSTRRGKFANFSFKFILEKCNQFCAHYPE